MPEQPSEQVLLRAGRFFLQEITETDLGSQDAYIENLVASKMNLVLNAFNVASNTVHLLSGTKETVAFTRMEALPFNSAYYLSEDTSTLYPTFRRVPSEGELTFKDNTFKWPVGWGSLWFAQIFSNSDPSVFRPGFCYLFAYRNGEFYHTHYPNVYANDGRICMGDAWDRNRMNNQTLLQQLFMHSYMTFLSTQLNTDLCTDDSREVFSRTAKDTTWAYGTGDNIILTHRMFPDIARAAGFLTT
jgi:hypothetical protein